MIYQNFLDIPQRYSNFKKSRAVIVPFPYEATTTYGRGAKFGPKAIIRASSQVELFDEELGVETFKRVGIATLKEIKPAKGSYFYIPLVKKVKKIISLGKFPIILGGEHTITLGGTIAMKDKFPSFSILHFDAHADLRDSYEGKKISHATTARRVFEQSPVKNIIQIGIRNISNEPSEGSEFDFYQKNKDKIKIFWARNIVEKFQNPNAKFQVIGNILSALNKNIYLTFDVDVFDPSIMPSTGTPEPGGIDWYQAISILKEVFQKKHVIACDVVELAPIKGFCAPDFMVAKLIYKMIRYKFLDQCLQKDEC